MKRFIFLLLWVLKPWTGEHIPFIIWRRIWCSWRWRHLENTLLWNFRRL